MSAQERLLSLLNAMAEHIEVIDLGLLDRRVLDLALAEARELVEQV